MRKAIAVAALVFTVACAREATTPPQPPTQQVSAGADKNVVFGEGADVGVAVYRDDTGCEWLIFRYRGYGVSTQERTEPTPTGRQQVCVRAK